jgi:hypothetical protein
MVEQYEDDFDDREPDRSGGDPGTLVVVVIIRSIALELSVSDRVEDSDGQCLLLYSGVEKLRGVPGE